MYICTENYHAGRMYADGNSLQNFPRSMHNPLAYGKLFDLDIKSCHPTILQYLTEIHSLKSTMLSDYVQHREDRLQELQERISEDRDYCKELVLALINGGGLQCHDTDEYLCTLKAEVVAITEKLLQIYPEYTTMKEDATERTPLALLLQDIENGGLQVILPLFKEYEPAVLCFDGVMTRKLVPPRIA
jgi:hypothetical protein